MPGNGKNGKLYKIERKSKKTRTIENDNSKEKINVQIGWIEKTIK